VALDLAPASVIARRQSQASGGTQTRLLHSVRNDTSKTTPDCFTIVRNDTPRAMPPPSNRVIARRQRRSNLGQRRHLNQIASLSCAMTPKNHPRLLHSVRNDTPRAAPPPSNRVIARRQRRSNLKPAVAPTPDCFTSVRNDTQKTPQIASLAFAMTLQGLPQITSRQCLNISSRPLANSTSRIQPFSWSWLAFASFASTHSGTSPNLKVSWVRTTSRASSRRPS